MKSVKLTLRNVVVWIVFAGILVPVISVTDDIVLLSAAVRELTSAGPVEVRSPFHGTYDDSSVTFWAQFEHMDFPVLPVTIPGIGRAGVICCPEPVSVSVDAPQSSVRGPPSFLLA